MLWRYPSSCRKDELQWPVYHQKMLECLSSRSLIILLVLILMTKVMKSYNKLWNGNPCPSILIQSKPNPVLTQCSIVSNSWHTEDQSLANLSYWSMNSHLKCLSTSVVFPLFTSVILDAVWALEHVKAGGAGYQYKLWAKKIYGGSTQVMCISDLHKVICIFLVKKVKE